jgi:hypothetical protein
MNAERLAGALFSAAYETFNKGASESDYTYDIMSRALETSKHYDDMTTGATSNETTYLQALRDEYGRLCQLYANVAK